MLNSKYKDASHVNCICYWWCCSGTYWRVVIMKVVNTEFLRNFHTSKKCGVIQNNNSF